MNTLEYYGIAELARALGWTNQKTYLYYTRKKFLEPVAYVTERPLWTKNQIEQMSSLWGRVTSE